LYSYIVDVSHEVMFTRYRKPCICNTAVLYDDNDSVILIYRIY